MIIPLFVKGIGFIFPGFKRISSVYQQFIIYAAIAALVLWGLRLWSNRIYEKGAADERVRVTHDLIDKYGEQWEDRLASIEADRAALDVEKKSLEEMKRLDREERLELTRTFSETIANISKERIKGYATAAAVPDDRVWNDIRVQSERLRRQSSARTE